MDDGSEYFRVSSPSLCGIIKNNLHLHLTHLPPPPSLRLVPSPPRVSDPSRLTATAPCETGSLHFSNSHKQVAMFDVSSSSHPTTRGLFPVFINGARHYQTTALDRNLKLGCWDDDNPGLIQVPSRYTDSILSSSYSTVSYVVTFFSTILSAVISLELELLFIINVSNVV